MKADMSPHSISMRIKKTSELRRLCIAMGGDRLRKRLEESMRKTTVIPDSNTPTSS